MKKILYIGNNLNSKTSNLSGIQTLGALLQTEGFSVFYASSYSNKIFRLLDMMWSCIKYRNRVDVVLIDTYSTQNFYYAYIIGKMCRFLKLDYVPILHGGKLPQRLEESPTLCKRLFQNSKCNVAPSLYLKNAFEERGFKNIVHIPNAIEIKNYLFKTRTYDTLNLLWVRSFSEIYNPQMAVKVLHELKTKYSNVSLCMVGPDADGTQLKVEQLSKDLGLEVKFTGKLKKEEWLLLAQSYNVFINTTNFDNTPVSLIEAMALGLPIVSTNVGGIPYLVGDRTQGLLVPANDVNAMVTSIEVLKNDASEREQLIKNARLKAESFDWNSIRTQWLQLLSS